MIKRIGKYLKRYIKNITVIKKKINLNNLAIMQGRLVDSEKIGEIQYFPKKNKKQEMAN